MIIKCKSIIDLYKTKKKIKKFIHGDVSVQPYTTTMFLVFRCLMQSLTTSGEHVAPDIIPFIYYYYFNEKKSNRQEVNNIKT